MRENGFGEGYFGIEDEPAHVEEWDLPISFDEHILPEFPNIYPAWLQKYVEAIAETTQTPKDMAAMAAISVLSIPAAKKFKVKVKENWMEPLNTFTVVLMGPGNRKSAVHGEMTKPIWNYEEEEQERLRIEVRNRRTEIDALKQQLEVVKKKYANKPDLKLIEQMRAINEEIESLPELSLPTYIVDDVTPEKLADILIANNGRVGLLSAEGGIFEIIKGRYSKELNMDVFLKGHSGDSVKVSRKSDGEKTIKEPALTIGIFAQPDIIKDLPGAFKGRGLTARFLYSMPKDFIGYRKIDPFNIPVEIRQTYICNVKRLLELQIDETRVLSLTSEASFFQQAFQQEIEQRLRPENDLGAEGDIKEWASKLVGAIMRIAALLHIAEHIQKGVIPEKIAASTVKKAFLTKDYFIVHAKAAFGSMNLDEDLENAKYVLEKITDKFQDEPVILHQQLWQLVKRRLGKSAKLAEILEILETRGFIKCGQMGRKKVIYVNPCISEAQKRGPNTPNSGSAIQLYGIALGNSNTL